MNTRERGETKNAMKNKEKEKLSLRDRTTEGESKRGGKKREMNYLKGYSEKKKLQKECRGRWSLFSAT